MTACFLLSPSSLSVGRDERESTFTAKAVSSVAERTGKLPLKLLLPPSSSSTQDIEFEPHSNSILVRIYIHSLCFIRDSLYGTVGEILEKIRDRA